jgi:hypothetical protein
MLRSTILTTLALTSVLAAQGRPCFAASDNLIFDDGISTGGPNLLIGIKETSGNVPLTVFAIEVFTGERPGPNTLGIWSHDAAGDRPLQDLGTGSFSASSPNGWQGANLPTPVTIAPNTTFWLVWGPQNGAQTTIERRNPNGAGQVYRGSFDLGQSWNGPFTFYDWKYRLWCQPISNPGVDVFGAACPAGSRNQPRVAVGALPRLGATVDLSVQYMSSLPGAPAFLAFGLSDQLWNGATPLPFDLGLLGAPTCSVLVDLAALVATQLDPSGAASYPLTVPNQPALLGGAVFAQWFLVDPQVNTLGFVTSQGVRLTVGS